MCRTYGILNLNIPKREHWTFNLRTKGLLFTDSIISTCQFNIFPLKINTYTWYQKQNTKVQNQILY